MLYLVIAGLVPLAFGLALLIIPAGCKLMCKYCDRLIFDMDKFVDSYRATVGPLLVLAAAFVGYIVLLYPQLVQLHWVWIVSLIFGLLFMFFPRQLAKLSMMVNRVVFDTEKVASAYCQIVAVILVITGFYILYVAFAIVRH